MRYTISYADLSVVVAIRATKQGALNLARRIANLENKTLVVIGGLGGIDTILVEPTPHTTAACVGA
jgi:hypothetical protein